MNGVKNYFSRNRTGMSEGHRNVLITAFSLDNLNNYLNKEKWEVYDIAYKNGEGIFQGANRQLGHYDLNRNPFYEEKITSADNGVKNGIKTSPVGTPASAEEANEAQTKYSRIDSWDAVIVDRPVKMVRRSTNESCILPTFCSRCIPLLHRSCSFSAPIKRIYCSHKIRQAPGRRGENRSRKKETAI